MRSSLAPVGRWLERTKKFRAASGPVVTVRYSGTALAWLERLLLSGRQLAVALTPVRIIQLPVLWRIY